MDFTVSPGAGTIISREPPCILITGQRQYINDPLLGSDEHDRECRDEYCQEFHWSCSHHDHCREESLCEHLQLPPKDWNLHINPLHRHTDITDGNYDYEVINSLDLQHFHIVATHKSAAR